MLLNQNILKQKGWMSKQENNTHHFKVHAQVENKTMRFNNVNQWKWFPGAKENMVKRRLNKNKSTRTRIRLNLLILYYFTIFNETKNLKWKPLSCSVKIHIVFISQKSVSCQHPILRIKCMHITNLCLALWVFWNKGKQSWGKYMMWSAGCKSYAGILRTSKWNWFCYLSLSD